MKKVYYDVSNLSVDTSKFKLFAPTDTVTSDYIEYNLDDLWIDPATDLVNAKVSNVGGEVSEKIPTAPTAGDKVALFNLTRYDDAWWGAFGG